MYFTSSLSRWVMFHSVDEEYYMMNILGKMSSSAMKHAHWYFLNIIVCNEVMELWIWNIISPWNNNTGEEIYFNQKDACLYLQDIMCDIFWDWAFFLEASHLSRAVVSVRIQTHTQQHTRYTNKLTTISRQRTQLRDTRRSPDSERGGHVTWPLWHICARGNWSY